MEASQTDVGLLQLKVGITLSCTGILVNLETILTNAPDNMPATVLLALEREMTDAILELSGSKYIGLIFGNNRMFLAMVGGEDFKVTPDSSLPRSRSWAFS